MLADYHAYRHLIGVIITPEIDATQHWVGIEGRSRESGTDDDNSERS
jgi:hypothetical protein